MTCTMKLCTLFTQQGDVLSGQVAVEGRWDGWDDRRRWATVWEGYGQFGMVWHGWGQLGRRGRLGTVETVGRLETLETTGSGNVVTVVTVGPVDAVGDNAART